MYNSVCLWIWGGQNDMFTSTVLCSGTQQPSLLSLLEELFSQDCRERRGKFPTFKVFMWHDDKQHNQFDWQSTQVENVRAKLLLILSDCVRSVFFSTVSRLRHTLCAPTRPPSPFWVPFERSWWTKPFQGCNRWTLSGSAYHQNALRHSVFLWKEGPGIVNDEAWCLSDAKLSRFKCCSCWNLQEVAWTVRRRSGGSGLHCSSAVSHAAACPADLFVWSHGGVAACSSWEETLMLMMLIFFSAAVLFFFYFLYLQPLKKTSKKKKPISHSH